MSANTDMNGLWSGEYRYDDGGAPVRFTAVITETDGMVSGTTLEPATFGPLAACETEYEATILGDRCGAHVWFTKRYVASTGILQPPLIYSGAVDAAFTRIAGRWAFTEVLGISGSFSLSRVASRTTAAMLQTATGTP